MHENPSPPRLSDFRGVKKRSVLCLSFGKLFGDDWPVNFSAIAILFCLPSLVVQTEAVTNKYSKSSIEFEINTHVALSHFIVEKYAVFVIVFLCYQIDFKH